MSEALESPKASGSGPRWHWLYFVLAGFDVFAVSVGLILNREIMGIYRRSVEENRVGASHLERVSRLSEYAAIVSSPGNNVFTTGRVGQERESMFTAHQEFLRQLELMRAELEKTVEPARVSSLRAALADVNERMSELVANGVNVFKAIEQRETEAAGRHMANMDRSFVEVNAALRRLQNRIGTIQQDQFEKQSRDASLLQQLAYASASLILFMVAGATWYGSHLARQVQAAQQEQWRSHEQLEARVLERTSEQTRTNVALRESEQARAKLLKQLISAQEEERRRIARDLHDEIGQSLTSLLLGFRTLEDAADVATARARAVELRRIAADTLDEVRRLARGLRPSVLDDLGLVAALERLAADFAQAQGLQVRLHLPEAAPRRLPETLETALYRIVQEALTNTAKHAGARQVDVRVERLADRMRVRVDDDGRGFDADAMMHKDGAALRGFGLSGMRERASLLHGSMWIDSQPGHGTRVKVEIPLSEEDHGEDSSVLGG